MTGRIVRHRRRGADILLGGDAAMAASREDVLAEEGVTDMDLYASVPGATPQVDLFVDHVRKVI